MPSLDRRRFLTHTSALGLVSVASGGLPRLTVAEPLGIPAGIQLWTVKEAIKADPAGAFKQLRQIGYRYVETAGFGDSTARDFRRLLDDADLRCPSAHLDFIQGTPEALFADAHTLGAGYVVSSILRMGTGAIPQVGPSLQKVASYFREMTLDDAKKTAEMANTIGLKAKKAGLRYVYHNHFFEFVDQGEGRVAYDVLLRETDPELVQFEIDCGWMKVAGRDPILYLQRYGHRIPMIHVKDFRAVDDKSAADGAPGQRIGTTLGSGFIDYRPIFAAAKRAGLKYYFAEQEGPFAPGTELDAAKASYGYLHSIQG